MKTINPLLSLLICLASTACDPVLSTGGSDLSQPTSASTASSAKPGSSDIRLNPVSLIGVVRARNGQALISNATVRINTHTVQSDSAGFYQLDALPEGDVKLIVMAPGYQAYTRTLSLKVGSQVEDIDLLALGETQTDLEPDSTETPTPKPDSSSEPAPAPSASGTLILLPDGSASVAPTASPSPVPSASANPSASPSVSPSPTASPTPEPPYDPILDQAVNSQLLISPQNNDLRLTFSLSQVNGFPVNWSKGTVHVEYFLANGDGSFLTSGRSVITTNGDSFVVSLGAKKADSTIIADYVLTLPNLSQIKKKETLSP